MTEKLYLITEAQRDKVTTKIVRNTSGIEVLDMLQSLPMVSGEPVAHMYPWDLERFATNETTGHAYSVAVGCPDGKSVPLYTSPQTPAVVQGETVEYLLDGMRIKLNFNSVGNITSLQNLKHDLQGRWVSFVSAENDKHLKATSPQAPVLVDSEPVAYSDGAFGGRFTYKCLNPAMILPDNTAFYTSPQALTPITAEMVTDEMHETFNMTHMPFGPDREIMAAAYNAVIKHRL